MHGESHHSRRTARCTVNRIIHGDLFSANQALSAVPVMLLALPDLWTLSALRALRSVRALTALPDISDIPNLPN
jgi:hypothetical protein